MTSNGGWENPFYAHKGIFAFFNQKRKKKKHEENV